MDSELLSIIVANRNNSQFLNECIDSILNQSFKNWELIVVDDFSTDNSLEILATYSEKDDRIRIIKNKNVIGVTKSRIKGIESSSSFFITTIDSDDYLQNEEKLSREIELIKKLNKNDGKYPIVYSGIDLVNVNGDFLHRALSKDNFKDGYVLDCFLSRNCAIPRDFVMTRSQYNEVGGYDKNFKMYEDWDLKIRLASRFEFYFSGLQGIAYRRHGKGLSSAMRSKHWYYINKAFCKNSILTKNKNQHVLKTDLKKNTKLPYVFCWNSYISFILYRLSSYFLK